MNYFLDSLSEGSTWRGLTLIATAAGIHISPALQEAIITAGLAASGLIGVLIKDKR
jgi:hypothetical protein